MSLRAVLGSYRLVVFSLWPAVFWVLLHGVQLPECYPQAHIVMILDTKRLDMISWECYQLFIIMTYKELIGLLVFFALGMVYIVWLGVGCPEGLTGVMTWEGKLCV